MLVDVVQHTEFDEHDNGKTCTCWRNKSHPKLSNQPSTNIREAIEQIFGRFGLAAAFWGINKDTNPKPTDPTPEILALFTQELDKLLEQKTLVTRSTGDSNYNIEAIPTSAVEELKRRLE